MISEYAKNVFDDFREQGATLEPEEIIRINALGVALERCADSSRFLSIPRVAVAGNAILRQPSMASERWFNQVAIPFARDKRSELGLLCFACAHAATPSFFDSLLNFDSVKKSVDEWTQTISATRDEMSSALSFVLFGNDPDGWETPAKTGLQMEREQKEAAREATASMPPDRAAYLIQVAAQTKLPFTLSELMALPADTVLDLILSIRKSEVETTPSNASAYADFAATCSDVARKHGVIFHG